MRLEVPVQRRARISLTPLIDVVFILLLFFMLTTRFGQQQTMQLRMAGDTGGAVQAPQESVILRLSDAGSIELADGSSVALDRLGTHPELIRIREQGLPVALEVDEQASLQALVSALDRFEAVGLVDVSVRGLR